MKKNLIKYLFIIFVILLIGLAVYLVYIKNNEKEPNNIKEASIDNIEYSKEINIGIANFDNINPLITNNKEVINISKIIFEPLIELNEKYEPQMCLVKEFAKISSTSFLVKINSDVKWEDGEKLSFEDIDFTIKMLQEGKSIYSDNVSNIKSVQKIDVETMKIDLNTEDPYFECKLIFPILQKKYYNGESIYKVSKTPKGTGLYKIKSINNDEIILELNENRRNKECVPKIEKINIKIYQNMGDLYNSFKIGNIDIINTSNIDYQKYIGTIGYKVKEYKGRNYDFLSLNCNNECLSNKEVRKAISFAIDKSNIISNVYNNQYYVADNPLDYGSYLYENSSVSLGYNPEQTKKILLEAGWQNINESWQRKNSSGKLEKLDFTLVVQESNPERVKVAEAVKDELKQVNINITIKQVSDEKYQEYLSNKNYDIIITGISNGFDQNLEYFYGANNIANYKNENVQKVILETKNISDRDTLKTKYKTIFESVQDEMPYIGLYRNKNFLIQNRNLNNNMEPNNYSIFYNIEYWYK